jgi:hypothetical protein
MSITSLKNDAIKSLWGIKPSIKSPQDDALSYISSTIKVFQQQKVTQHLLKSDRLQALSKLAREIQIELQDSSYLAKLGFTDFKVSFDSGKFVDESPCLYYRLCLTTSSKQPRWYLVPDGPSDWKAEAFGSPCMSLVDNHAQVLADVWAPAIRDGSSLTLGKCIHLMLDAMVRAIDTGVSRQNLQPEELSMTHERRNYFHSGVYCLGQDYLPWEPLVEHPQSQMMPIGEKHREYVAGIVNEVSKRVPFIYSGDLSLDHGIITLVNSLQHHFSNSQYPEVSVQVGLRCVPHDVAPSVVDGSFIYRFDYILALWIYPAVGCPTPGRAEIYAGVEYNPALNPCREGLLRGYKLLLDELEASIRNGSSSTRLIWFS